MNQMKAGADIILESPAVLNASLYILPTIPSANVTHSNCTKIVLCCSKKVLKFSGALDGALAVTMALKLKVFLCIWQLVLIL